MKKTKKTLFEHHDKLVEEKTTEFQQRKIKYDAIGKIYCRIIKKRKCSGQEGELRKISKKMYGVFKEYEKIS